MLDIFARAMMTASRIVGGKYNTWHSFLGLRERPFIANLLDDAPDSSVGSSVFSFGEGQLQILAD